MLGRRENLPRVTPTRRVRRTSHARLQRRVEASSSEVGVGTVLENPSTRAAYELVERLGSGSFADTFRAQTSTGDEVAVKTLTLRSGKRGGMNGGFKAVELFERECATLRSMRHPNVPEYLDSFSLDTADDRRYVLVHRLARGSTLQQRVESGWRPTEVEIKSVLRQLLEVAKYCCALRPPVIHRDIKPANVVLDHDGMVNVVDFGSAAAAAIEDPLGGFGSTIVGTFGYMAPEVMMRQSSVRSDQYGIGSTILYLLSGRPPSGFAMERLKINFDDVYIEDRQLRRVVERLLEPSPEDRWRDPQEALDALDAKPPMVSGRNFRRRPSDIDVLAPSGSGRPGRSVLAGSVAVGAPDWGAETEDNGHGTSSRSRKFGVDHHSTFRGERRYPVQSVFWDHVDRNHRVVDSWSALRWCVVHGVILNTVLGHRREPLRRSSSGFPSEG